MPFKTAPLEVIDEASCVTTVGAPAEITNCCVTDGAGALVPSPACEAVIEQVPGETITIFVPLIVQTEGVFETKVTVNPEVAVAFEANGVVDIVLLPGLANVIV